MQKRVEAINPDSDLQAFVNANRPENPQPPPRAQYMSWDGTLIEDLGPRKEQAVQSKPLNNSGANQSNSEIKAARVDNAPKAVETKVNQPVQQAAPIQQVSLIVLPGFHTSSFDFSFIRLLLLLSPQ